MPRAGSRALSAQNVGHTTSFEDVLALLHLSLVLSQLPSWPPLPMQNITDEDVLALVNDEVHQPEVVWVLEDLQASWWLPQGSLGWCNAGWL